MAWLAAIPQIVGGIYQTAQSQRGLNKLASEPLPEYSVSPELKNAYGRAEQMSNQGYTGAEQAAFGQNVAQQQNTGFQQGIEQSGGNLAQALRTGFGAQKLNAQNDFAASDANLHRANIHYADSLAQEVQNQSNLINQNKIQRRTMLEQAYGAGKTTGISNIMGGSMASLYSLAGGGAPGNNAWLGNANSGNRGSAPGISDGQYSDMVDKDINSGYFNK